MGLFNNKAKVEAINMRLATKLDALDITEHLMQGLAAVDCPENYWVFHSVGYYDPGKRTVVVSPDGLIVFNCAVDQLAHLEKALKRSKRAAMLACVSGKGLERVKELQSDVDEKIDDLMNRESISLNYTEYGYEPLSEYQDEQSGCFLDMTATLRVWAEVLQRHMEAVFPNLYYDGTLENIHLNAAESALVAFSYDVPDLVWKTWF